MNLPLMRALEIVMSEISENCWCAGWLSGLEFDLWRIISTPYTEENAEFGQYLISRDDYDMLKELAHVAGGWYADYQKPVPLGEWLPIYDAWAKTNQ